MRKVITELDGQALVELALVLSILILVAGLVIELGRVLNVYLILCNASREGARLGIVGAPDDAIKGAVSNASTSLDRDKLNVYIEPGKDDRKSGESLRVRVTYDVSIVFPMASTVLPNPFPVVTQTIMRME
jgi:hypothetical protein